MIGDCANCKSHICAGRGISCKKINQDEVIDLYTDEEKKIMKAAAFVEATYYSELTRLEETVEFAKQMCYKKLGLAFCIGLNKEAYLINKYDYLDYIVLINVDKSISFRGKDKVDLSIIAKKYNGGGHFNAAGSPLPKNLKEIIMQEIFKEAIIMEEKNDSQNS